MDIYMGHIIKHEDGMSYCLTILLQQLASFELKECGIEKMVFNFESFSVGSLGYIPKPKPIKIHEIKMPTMLEQVWQMKINGRF